MTSKLPAVLLIASLAICGSLPLRAEEKKYPTLTNKQVIGMLDQLEQDLKENYYDPSFHGVDLAARFKEARAKIENAPTQDDAFLHVAAAMASLNDSHTSFNPPIRPYHVEYGFEMQPYGEQNCFVTAVRKGSDAEAKGLKPGDRIVSITGIQLSRQNFEAVELGYRVFPQSGFHLTV